MGGTTSTTPVQLLLPARDATTTQQQQQQELLDYSYYVSSLLFFHRHITTITMSGYGEPEWINPGQNNDIVAEADIGEGVTAAQADTGGSSGATGGGGGKGGCVLCMLSLMDMALAGLMTALGVLTLIQVHRSGVGALSEPFLAAYMIMFAALLFLYELMWWSPFPSMNKSMRKNFGFLYGLRGKGLYIIFMAFLCFGLGKDASVKEMNYATGAAFLAGGLLHWFVICFHPNLAMKYQAPTAGLIAADASSPSNNENVV